VLGPLSGGSTKPGPLDPDFYSADLKGWYLSMKVLKNCVFVAVILLLLVSSSTAQVDNLKEMTIVVPAESIARVIQPLLPYRMDFGKNFRGDFWIQSIENIKIKKDRILFSSLITGKDIKYATKIGKQVVNIVVGKVNLRNHWEVSLKYDKSKKTLLVKPLIKGPANKSEFSQGDALLNTLLEALGGLEYPVDVNNLKPLKSELYDQLLTVNFDVSDIYTGDNKLFVEIIPSAQINSLNEQ
jgi:hypothetical protein